MIYYGFAFSFATSLGIKWMHVLCSSHEVVMILFVQGSIFDIQTSCQSTYGYALLILNTRLHGVFPLLWSIREMCCIISMLGRDAHINSDLAYNMIWTFISHWWTGFCPPQLYERIVKWTHEPRSTFYHKKHLYLAFTLFSISCTILFRKYKKIFNFLICIQNTKNNQSLYSFLLSYFV